MAFGTKHLVECHCILPQYKNHKDPVFHKFVVFSIIDDSDTCIPKIVNCNNCGASHKVYDLCKSEIVTNTEETAAAMSIEDFKLSLPDSLFDLLKSYDKEICDFEYSQFILDEKKWGSTIVLTKENVKEKIEGKILKFLEVDKFRVESFSHKEVI